MIKNLKGECKNFVRNPVTDNQPVKVTNNWREFTSFYELNFRKVSDAIENYLLILQTAKEKSQCFWEVATRDVFYSIKITEKFSELNLH